MNILVWSLDISDDEYNDTNDTNNYQYIKLTVNIDFRINYLFFLSIGPNGEKDWFF